MTDLLKLVKLLQDNQVQFVVVGGFATLAHGGSMVTEDMDVCCEFSAENLLQIQEAFAAIHPIHRMTPRRIPLQLDESNVKGLKNLYLSTDLGQIDLLGRITGLGDFSEVWENSVQVILNGMPCQVLSLDALIRAKEALGRPRDLQAVLQLKAIREMQDGRSAGEC
jgi:hypothetical protein